MRTTVLLGLLGLPFMVIAQDYVQPAPATPQNTPTSQVSLGFGLGLDYGGLLGAHVEFAPDPHIAAFGGVGYALIGAGYNVGMVGRLLPQARVCPFLTAMYGYNAVIKIEGASEYDQLYYGPTFGAGVEFHKRSSDNFWRVAILLPIRPSEFQEDIDALKKNPAIEIKAEPPAFGISGGFHFSL